MPALTDKAPLRARTLADLTARQGPAGPQGPSGNITTSTGRTAQQRLEQAAAQFNQGEATFSESMDSLQRLKGYDNPYGRGLSAYEPNTVLFNDYRNAKSAVDASKAAEKAAAEAAASTTQVDFRQQGGPDYAGGGQFDAQGAVGRMIAAAQDLANRRVPYVWGGTGRNGVDCSGMIYYAARAAGIDIARYRAVDYGRMGTGVNLQDARAGDIVYFDNPGDTDHVGIYLGNGQMIQAPQTGDVVRVSAVGRYTSIRRVFNDDQFAAVALPSGASAASYNGAAPVLRTGAGTAAPATASAIFAPTSSPTTTVRRTGSGPGRRAI